MDQVNDVTRKLPGSFYNTISMIGSGIAGLSFIAILFLFLVDVFTETSTPYVGIINYLVFPTFLIVGMILVPIGMWREHRRRALFHSLPSLPRVDLNVPHHRRMFVLSMSVISLFCCLAASAVIMLMNLRSPRLFAAKFAIR